MVTTRYYSDQQGSKSRQNRCQVQPTENIRNISASRRYLRVQTTEQFLPFGVLTLFQNLKYLLQKSLSNVLPSNVIKSDSKSFLTLGGLHEDWFCVTLQAIDTEQCQKVHQASLLHIESNLDRLGLLLSPTHGQRFDQQAQVSQGHTRHAEIRKNEIPRSMVVEILS